MAYSDPDVSEVYVGDGVTTNFAIPFDYVEEEQIKVELYDVTDPDNPVQVTPFISPDDWFIDNDIVTTVQTVVAPTADQKLLVYRESESIHETLYNTYEFPFGTANNDFDYIYQAVQELQNAIERAIINPLFNVESGNGDVLTIEQIQTTLDTVADITAELLDLQNQIDSNDTDIADLQSQISDNDADIAGLQTQIDSNDVDIADLQSQITDNDQDIANILTILGNSGQIVIRSVAGTYVASAFDRVIAKIAGVQVDLPLAPVANEIVTVKNRGVVGTIVSGNGNNIDGAASITMSSVEESKTLVYDGTEWNII